MIGLPSLQALDRAQSQRIWLAAGACDMRQGFDRLAERVRAVIGQDPHSGHLFLFRSRRGDRMKILAWERDGFALWYKFSEVGSFAPSYGANGNLEDDLVAGFAGLLPDGKWTSGQDSGVGQARGA